MATRISKQIPLLGLIAALLLVISGEWAVFSHLEAQQSRSVATVIGAQLRDESTMSRTYLLAQSIEDLQAFGVIRCAKLSQRTSNGASVFYDSTFKEGCGTLSAISLRGLDGNDWELQVAATPGLGFYLMKWLTMAISGLLLFGVYFLVRRYIAEERRRRSVAETQRALLEELTIQVSHDVASPMTALRFIADRAPLDAETKEFLRQAVARTHGIFATLNQARAISERFLLRNEIEKIVNEKRRFDSKFPDVELNLGDTDSIHAPPIEFGRAISNLLNNACQADAKVIRITSISRPGQLIVEMDDDGAPIPDSVITRLGERGNSVRPGGTGLGLAHSYQLLKSLGGEMVVRRGSPKVELQFPTGS